MVNVFDGACTWWGMTISGRKAKLLADGEQQHSEQPPITLKGQSQEGVESFFYLDSEAGQDGKVEKKVTVRLVKARVVGVPNVEMEGVSGHNLSKDTKLYVP